jgi:FtsZ-binding cell division protein ZapB
MPPHTMSELMVQVELLTAEINKLKEENRSLADENRELRVRFKAAVCSALSEILKEVD